jgi:hypothetical protein
MDHSEALRTKAAERYLLGELTGDIREEYEQHVFSCSECAQDVQAGAAFVDSARKVLTAEPAPDRVPAEGKGWLAGWLRPAFAVPALALLLLVIGYQNAVVIPNLKNAPSATMEPRALRSFSFIASNSRGGGPVKISVEPNQPFGLFVDIPPQDHFDSYLCEFETESGATELSIQVSAEEAKETVQLLIPASRLVAGKHLLVVRGLKSSQGPSTNKIEVARFPFTLESTQ